MNTDSLIVPVVLFLLNGLMTLALFFLGLFVKSLSSRITEVKREVDRQAGRGERLAALEERLGGFEGWLRRIDEKLERLVQRAP